LNQKAHYRVRKSSILNSHLNAVHTFTPYFLNIHFNIIVPTTPRSPTWSLPFRFSD